MARAAFLSEDDVPNFPLSFDTLIGLSKAVIDSQFGSCKPELLADDFEFKFPVVELNKARFVEAFGSFKLNEAFPDMTNEYYGFRADPHIPGRVWMDTQGKGTHTGNFGGPFSYIKPTQKEVVLPPQALSFTFNEEGLLKLFTGGYVIDRHMGNTGGLGGVFGIMHAIGKTLPFPDAQPVSVSMRYKFFLSLDQVARQAYTGYSKIPEDTFTLKKLYDVSSNTKEKAVEMASGYYSTALEYPLYVYTSTKDKVFESGYIPKDALEKVASTKDSVMQSASGYYISAREYPLGVYTSAKEKVSSTKDKVIKSASGYIPKDALEKVVSTKDSVMQSASGYYTSARN
eukprot:CAMPEP_0198208382 /NCGR_PEP_ID=MMETSP1445-20131203/11751_1 /TAXON_ID=36898 /ORGANISM="Pyramimonas sp., Strain CCMP2087" /LENGTH=342 /DNA_ID=CAMNT_0043881761 /DNA_START=144 /DNA_END=1169 /DNA_ORIENTATION=+